MRDLIGKLFSLVGAILALIGTPSAVLRYMPKMPAYALVAEVFEIEKETDTVIVKDGTGDLWVFYGYGNWEKGDHIICVMSNSGTPGNIYDDKIVNVI